jgi:hypothetical protein
LKFSIPSQAKNVKVVLGDHDVNTTEETESLVPAVKEVSIHPGACIQSKVAEPDPHNQAGAKPEYDPQSKL